MLYYRSMDINNAVILSGMILSLSGWRGIFAASGDDNSDDPEINLQRSIFIAASARVFSDYLKKNEVKGSIIIGRDTRPTGKKISDVILYILSREGWDIRLINECAAPEIMAYARSLLNAAGFIYISASHNPLAYNGLKFGLCDGGVLPDSETAELAAMLKTFLGSKENISSLENDIKNLDKNIIKQLITYSSSYKNEALKVYEEFSQEVISGFTKGSNGKEIFNIIRRGIKENPLGICADFNGSARTVTIDRDFLSDLGINFISINDKPGIIQYQIVPEGESLNLCREFLEQCHKENPSFILGYKPDCDGDRGNLVIWDHKQNQGRLLEAQEVFALACMAELAYLVWTGQLKHDNKGKAITRSALVVNDPTSLRIDRIAQAFDVQVFRSEVGEANVVSLARKLREEGYLVRILGEGSNGGNITHPAAVRDPLNTLGALIKLLTIRSGDGKKGLFESWCYLSDQADLYHQDFNLTDIIATLPAFITTGSYSNEGVLKIKTIDHSLLKERYQKIFLKNWEIKKEELKLKYGIISWDVCAYNGIVEKPGINNFSEAGQGGLKIGFLNNQGQKIACIWMRGSRTEPVFRIMADAEGQDPCFERDLIEWQTWMLTQADEAKESI